MMAPLYYDIIKQHEVIYIGVNVQSGSFYGICKAKQVRQGVISCLCFWLTATYEKFDGRPALVTGILFM